jgi:hypothetical protein
VAGSDAGSRCLAAERVNEFISSRSLLPEDRANSSTAIVEDIRQRRPPMFPIEVHPGWYDAYWYSERQRPRRRSLAERLARFTVLIVLLAGGGVALGHSQAHRDVSGAHDWEQE